MEIRWVHSNTVYDLNTPSTFIAERSGEYDLYVKRSLVGTYASICDAKKIAEARS